MDITIRNAQIEDAESIAELSVQLGYEMNFFQTQEVLEELACSELDVVLVAINNDEIVAWAQVSYAVRVESGRFCELVGLVVDEKYRGEGIGEKLLEAAATWSKTKGCDKLRVRSNTKRVSTASFYTKKGFSLTKTQNVFDKIL